MAQTITELYNLAAQAVGNRGKLVSVASRSREVDVFNLWYPLVRSTIFAAANWPSTKKTATLSPVLERSDSADWANGSPAPGAKYGYLAPPDMLRPRWLSTFGHFSIEMVGTEKIISTHESPAILSYTFDQEDLGKLEPELFLLLAQALGAYTCMTLTGKASRARELERGVNNTLTQAQATGAEMQQQPTATVASWHAARGYIGAPNSARYIYPYGALIAVGESAGVK